MKGLLVLGCAFLAALSCRAAPALNRSVECAEAGVASAAHLTLHHINDHHKHGYHFQLREIRSSKVEKVDGKCGISLDLSLEETKCHIVDPKHFEECEFRDRAETPVVATCNVTLIIKDGDAFVTRYNCETKTAITKEELIKICPDCNSLLDLEDKEGLKGVAAAVRLFNQNTTHERYYVLQDVGRMSLGYMMSMGMMYYSEYALVETHCPMGSRILPEACTPLCPNRARHAFCHSTYTQSSENVSQRCEIYEAENTTALAEGEKEHICPRFGPFGFPPHAHGEDHPPRDGERGPPRHGVAPDHEHAEGAPGHGHVSLPSLREGHPPRLGHICRSSSKDKAVHPICDWPSARS